MKRFLPSGLFFLFCLSVAAEVRTLPLFPLPETPDTEVAVCAELPAWSSRKQYVRFMLTCPTTETNCVEICLGKDENADGMPEAEESCTSFGWDCGAWFLATSKGVRKTQVAADDENAGSLQLEVALRSDGKPRSVCMFSGTNLLFQAECETSADDFFNPQWDSVMMLSRGLDTPVATAQYEQKDAELIFSVH